jgi:putative phage-type endonuclease
MIITSFPQNTVEWLEFRIGKITASRVGDVMNFRKDGKRGADRLRYLSELVAERLTGRAADHYVTPAMERGTDEEPFARAAYEVATGVDVEQVGAVVHPTMDYFSASPDGLVGTGGMVEFKNPTTIKHLDWIRADIVPAEHEAQMLAGMACAERAWCDFVSFDSRLPAGLRVFTKRLMRDEDRIAEIQVAVCQFNDEIIDQLHQLREFSEASDPPSKPQPAFEGDMGITDEDIQSVYPSWQRGTE